MTHKEKAAQLLYQGYHCSQALFGAFAGDFGMDLKTAFKISTCFAGGMRQGGTCGCITASMLVLGLAFGFCDPQDRETEIYSNRKTEEFIQRFKDAMEDRTRCQEILGKDISTPEGMAAVRQEKMILQKCPRAISASVDILEDMLTEYLQDIQAVQEFAKLNRRAILDELAKGMKWKIQERTECVHNYIDASGDDMILRKGAISAKEGESVIIPINMRDGILLGVGKGNADWNYSAPHGAGRKMKREDVKARFTVSQFKAEMNGIYSSCIGKSTLDEAPFAYRNLKEIEGQISDTVEIRKRIKPVYNFKAE